MPKNPDKLILIYDGDSGLVAMLSDVVKKAVGREDCPLCEITYGPLGKKRAWEACAARLPIAIVEVHRNRVPPEWGIARAALPCILARVAGEPPYALLGRQEIASCHGSVEELERRLVRALRVTTTSPSLETAP